MRKWYRLYPSALALGALLAACILPPLFTSARAATSAPAPAQRASVAPFNLPPSLPSATGYTTVDAFALNGSAPLIFNQPLGLVAPPGEKDRLFVIEKAGTIQLLTDLDGKNGGPKKSLFMDLVPYLKSKGMTLGQTVEWGLLGLAFHPNFKDNGYFYIRYDPVLAENGANHGFNRLSRFSVSKTNPNLADMTSELPLITQLDPAPNHNGGCVRFGPDGYLYFANGDGGGANDQYDNARWIDRGFFAAIFRLDVDRLPENIEPNAHTQASTRFPSAVERTDGKANYKIPADNPLIGATTNLGQPVDPLKVRTEIYAHGLRNAWRFSFDDPTGRLFVGEVGQDLWEEVDIIKKGGNYGWSYRESLHNGPRAASTPPDAKFDDPIYEYRHGSGYNCISGGFVYRGNKLTELNGAYIFGDYGAREVAIIREKDNAWTHTVLARNVGQVVAIEPDPRNGDPLIISIGPGAGGNNAPINASGRIFRLVRTGVQGPPPPPLLSQVAAFKDLKTLEPVPGMIPYAPNVTFWSDYALKQRWFLIPNAADSIGFDPTGNWKFPTGMVWVKHFEMEMKRGDPSSRRRLETRFLMKTAAGTYGITYKWRPDGSDADLVSEVGQDEVLTITDGSSVKKQTWHYPSQSECLSCHTSQAGDALAFNTWQLNGTGNGKVNQIDLLANAGYFAPGTTIPPAAQLGAYAKADDPTASLEWRVRSYLAVNCVQCHQPGGVVQGQWDARPTTPLDQANIVKGPLVANRGDAAAQVIVPGDLVHSMLLKRIQANGVPRMPPLATNELDPTAAKLLQQWIQSLKP